MSAAHASVVKSSFCLQVDDIHHSQHERNLESVIVLTKRRYTSCSSSAAKDWYSCYGGKSECISQSSCARACVCLCLCACLDVGVSLRHVGSYEGEWGRERKKINKYHKMQVGSMIFFFNSGCSEEENGPQGPLYCALPDFYNLVAPVPYAWVVKVT